MSEPLRIYLPAPAPYAGPPQFPGLGVCPFCAGTGLTDDQYEQAVPGGDTVIVVDTLCPACEGCGRFEHDECRADQHAQWEGPDEDDWEAFEAAGVDPCPSCRGRQWNAVQGFDDEQVVYLRMPCGCAEPLMVVIDADGQPVGPMPAERRVHT